MVAEGGPEVEIIFGGDAEEAIAAGAVGDVRGDGVGAVVVELDYGSGERLVLRVRDGAGEMAQWGLRMGV